MLPDLENLIRLLGRLPGLGPRSARRAVLELMKKRESLMQPLARALADAAERIETCERCGNLDLISPCSLCTDGRRLNGQLCVVEEVADLWALERAKIFTGRYHVLGGHLSALDGITPDDLRIESLLARAADDDVSEVVLALGATVEGQTTAHYLTDQLARQNVKITRLALGLPVGGELNYLDEGTLTTAFRARNEVHGR